MAKLKAKLVFAVIRNLLLPGVELLLISNHSFFNESTGLVFDNDNGQEGSEGESWEDGGLIS